jgi:RHS repeat-associated protein
VTYLHNDHLGSVSVATSSGGALASQQEFYPWGTHRGSGDITQTTLDFTGQWLDGSKLLYYHARYYDPGLGRFVSADSIVPGADALAIGPGGAGGGPANPQSLNRYSYVNNNPINHTDPSGHCIECAIVLGGAALVYLLGGRCLQRKHRTTLPNIRSQPARSCCQSHKSSRPPKPSSISRTRWCIISWTKPLPIQ